MSPFWHLTTVCCIPMFNPQGRLKEQKILREAAVDAVSRAAISPRSPKRSRWSIQPDNRAAIEGIR
jgi:hypothetical protein